MKASSMADRSGKSSDGLASGAGPRGAGRLGSEMLMMFRITSPQRTKIVLLGVALVLVIAATAFGQIRLNAWNQPFYNALQRRDLRFLVPRVSFGLLDHGLRVRSLMMGASTRWLTPVRGSGETVNDVYQVWARRN